MGVLTEKEEARVSDIERLPGKAEVVLTSTAKELAALVRRLAGRVETLEAAIREEIDLRTALPAPTAPREAAEVMAPLSRYHVHGCEFGTDNGWQCVETCPSKRPTPTESTGAKCRTRAVTGKYCAEWRRLGYALECAGCKGTTPTSEESK